ncbi:MAG: ATP synthase F1 subunit delta [Lachnospiraceae bacterium]|nr:ATP synthase F1 subunit delta [Lachnospiraceae bacterium]
MAKLVEQTYGEALFQTAMETNQLDAFLEEVKLIQTVLEQNPEWDRLMKHPKISKQEKVEIMRGAFAGRISREMTGFLELILTKERYGQLQAVFRYFTEKVKEEKKIGTAYVTTPMELSEIRKSDIQDKLLATTSYRTMEMHYTVDPSLIGGMVIRIKDRVVDSSIRTKLAEMKKELLQIQLG